MNILYTNFHYSHGGGHTTYILALLRNQKHTCYVACPGSSRLYRILHEAGYERLIDLSFPSKLGEIGKTIANTKRLKGLIEKYDIDIIHTNGSGDNRMALYTSWICKKKFKVVYTKHNTLKVKGWLSRWRLNNFNDAVILVAESVIDAAGLQPNERYYIIENGVDTEYWKREQPITSGGDKIHLVSNAGTARAKGWIHLFEALDLLSESERERFKVTLLGRDDASLMERLDDLKARYDFNFAGYLDDPRLEMEKGDVGFILSYREACSFATREMMSMSLPILASNFAGSQRDVTPETGWITQTKDPESIRNALLAILQLSPAELENMKWAARSRAERLFSLEKMIQETNKVYAHLCPDKN